MISINKYGQNIDFSQIVAVNGKKSLSLDGLVLDKSLIIEVTKGTKFSTTLQEEDLKIEFKDVDGNIFELILKNMATLLAQNDGTQLVEIIQADDNKVLASITDITSALEAAAAGGAPAAGANGNSDSASNAGLNNDENNLSNSTYDNASLTNDLNTATTATALSRANVAPIVAAIADQNVDEDNTLLINFSALDLNNDTLVSTATALNGTVTVNGNIITYVPNTNFNGNDTITLTVNDGLATTTQTIVITVNPINDAPVLNTITAVTVNEDDSVFSGTITSSDVDANATAVYTTTSTVAGFTLNSNGTYTFDAADVAYQSLAAGVSQIITIPVTVTDDANATDTQNLTITITGTNDAPVLNTITAVTVNEDDSVFSGTITSSDVDANATAVYTTTSTVAGFTLNSNGTYTFDAADVAYQSLAAGVSQIITIPVTVTDDANATDTQNLTITITGTNDAPVLNTITAVTVNEDDSVFSGTITSSDVDANATAVYTTTSTVAGFTLNSNGTYTFDAADVAYQSLAAGVSQIITIPVTVTDDANATDTQNLTITITGTNDAPVLNTITAVTVNEDDSVFSGTITSSDVDANATAVYTTTSTVAGFTLNSNGTYTFDAADVAYQSLAAGVSQIITIPVTVTDDANATDTQNLTITITGTNDAPVLNTITAVTVNEDDSVFSGTITSSDVDANATAVYTTTSTVAGFTLNSNGTYTFDAADVAYQSLAAGVSQIITIPVTVTDDANATDIQNLTITITGTNDRPTIENININAITLVGKDLSDTHALSNTGDNVAYSYFTVTETTVVRITTDGPTIDPVLYLFRNDGNLDVTDYVAYNDDGWTQAGSANNSLINITLTAGNYIAVVGDYGFSMNEAISGINNGSYRDGNVSINFLADKDIILYNSNTTTSLYIEDSGLSNNIITGVINTVSDLDTADIHTYELVPGTALVNGVQLPNLTVSIYLNTISGNWEYKIDGDFNYLSEGEIANVTFDYIANDGKGFDGTDGINESSISESKVITLTVTGTNDTPTVSAYTETRNVQENVLTGSISLTDVALVDVDLTDTHTFVALTNAVTTVVDTNSVGIGAITVSMDVNGNYTLSGAGIEKLGAGESATVTFSVQVKDDSATATNTSTPATITLTIDGSNDTPTVSDVAVSVLETDFAGMSNLVYTSTTSLIASDVDATDTYTFAKSNFAGTTGEVGLQVSLVQSDVLFMQAYNLASAGNATALIALKAAFLDLISTPAIAAIVGASNTLSTLTADITSASDFATLINVINANSALSLSATSTSVTVTAEATAAQTATLEAIGAINITVNTDGTYSLSTPLVNNLAEGEVAIITFGYTATDNSGTATATSEAKTVSLTVTGTNDTPTVSDVAVNVSESTFADVSGMSNLVYTSTTSLIASDVDATDTYTFAKSNFAGTTGEVGLQVSLVQSDVLFMQAYNLASAGNATALIALKAAFLDLISTPAIAAIVGASNTLSTLTADITSASDFATLINVINANSALSLSATSTSVTVTAEATAAQTATLEAIGAINITVNTDGTYSLSTPLVNNLAEGEVAIITFGYTATDNSGTATATSEAKTVSLTVTGTNDTPTVSAYTETTNVQENVLTGSISLTDVALVDVDLTDTHTFVALTNAVTTVVDTNSVGIGAITVSMDVNGNYTLSGAGIEKLGAGESATVTFSVQVKDDSATATNTSTPATITLTIDGSNDTPTVSDVAVSVLETDFAGMSNLVYTSTTSLIASDVDATDTYTFAKSNFAGTTGEVGLQVSLVQSDVLFMQAYNLASAGNATALIALKAAFLDLISTPAIAAIVGASNTLSTLTADITSASDFATLINVINANSALSLSATSTSVTVTAEATAAQTATLEAIGAINITVNTDGTYSLSTPLVNNLAEGEVAIITFGYTATDNSGTATATSEAKTVSLTVTGTNDTPTVSAYTETTNVQENVLTGSISLTDVALVDVDLTDTHTFVALTNAVTTVVDTNSVGIGAITVSMDVNGNYTLSGAGIEKLGAGESATVTFSVQVKDDSATATNTSTPATITLTIDGSNDTPTVSDVAVSVLETDFAGMSNLVYTSTTSLIASDVDATDTYTFAKSNFAGTTGEVGLQVSLVQSDVLFMQAYNLASAGNATALIALKAAFLDLISTPAIAAIVGASNTLSTLTADITSASDFATLINVINANSALSLSATSTSVTVTAEATAAQTATLEAIGAINITVNTDGTYSLSTPLVNNLAEGEVAIITFGYTATDNSGTATATSEAKTVSLTVTGTNDTPTVSDVAVNVSESTFADVSGMSNLVYTSTTSLIASDVDATDTYTFAKSNFAGTTGEVGLQVSLVQSDVLFMQAYNLASAGNATALIALKAAFLDLISTPAIAAIVGASNTLSTLTADITSASDFATLINVINANSALSLSATSTSVTVTAEATAAQTATLEAIGAINITVNTDGTYSLSTPLVNNLAEGEVAIITFGYTATDNSGTATATSEAKTVSLTVTGTNDTPTVSAYTETTNVQENVLTGSISLTDVALVDVDLTDTHTFVALTNAVTTVVDTNSVGIGAITVSMDVNGNYTLSGAGIEKLGAGESATVTFSVQVKDDSATATNTSTPATITLTIDGSNDTPTISSDAQTVIEDASALLLTTNGTVTVVDVDNNESFVTPQTNVAGLYGTFNIDANGVWTYSADNTQSAIQALSATDTLTETFTVTSKDGTATSTIVVTIQGTNDIPVAVNDILSTTNTHEILVSEDFENGATGWSDNTTTITSGNATNFLGRFGGSSGAEAVSKEFDFGVEHAGETVTITFDMYEIDSWDDELFIVFVNGVAVESDQMSHYGRTWSTTTDEEDGGTAINNVGNSGLYYYDHDESHSYVIQATVGSDGKVTLGFGSTLNERLDNESYGIDNLVITAGDNWSTGVYTLEDTAITINASDILANDSDVDAGDTLSILAVTATSDTHGTVSLDANGNVLFTPESNYYGLSTFEYTLSDGNGGTDVATVSLNVVSVNDVPTISSDAQTVIEDASAVLSTNGTVTVVDTDNNESFVIAQTNTAGTYGTFNVDVNGVWTYSADNTQSAIQALSATDTLTETFTVTSKDGTATSTVVVTIQGTNDTPTVSDVAVSVLETDFAGMSNLVYTSTTSLIASDVDATDTYTFAKSNFAGTTGEVGLQVSLVQSDVLFMQAYNLASAGNATALIALKAAFLELISTPAIAAIVGASNTLSTLTADITSASSFTALINVINANSALSLSATSTSVTVTAEATAAQTATLESIGAINITVNTDGTYSLSTPLVNNLAEGEVAIITFGYTATDNSGTATATSDVKTVSLTVTGTNDAPIIAPVSNLVIESSLLDTPDAPSADSKYEGQLSATDADLTDTHTFYRSGTTLGLTITTSSSGLVNAFDTDQIEYVRNVVLKIVSIDEIKTLIDSTTDVDALAVINAVKNAPSIDDLKLILESVGITTTLDTTAGTLTFNVLNAHILEELNLIEIDIMPTDGSYSITSSLFNHLGVSDNISLSFGYVAKDSSNEFSDPNTVTLKITGTNDTPVVTKPVEINVIEDTTTIDVDINSDKALSNYIYDFDITDDHNFNRFGETLGLTITTSSSGLVNAFDTDQIEYVRNVVLKIVSIDEIKTLIDSTTDVDALAVINAVKNAPSIDDLKLILESVGITTTLDTTAGTLTFNVLNAYILEELNLIEINMLTDGDGSYSITSSLFNHLGVADTLSLSFGYSVTDSGAETVNDGIVTVNIQGTNDIPTINDVTISTNENTLTNSTKLEIGIDNQFALSNYSFDPDVTDDFTYLRSETNTKLGLTITSQDAVLLAAVENNNNLAYVKTLVSELISIPEIAAVLSSITNTTILTLIGQLQMATSVTQLVNMINAIPTVSLIKDASGLNLVLEDASILETTNLLKIVIDGSGSYTVESALFDRMSATTSVSLNFDYEAQDSGYSGGITQEATITVNIAGSNDRPEVIKVIVSNIETNGTQNFTGQLTATDADVGSVFTFEMVSTGGNNKNITNDGRQFESIEINGVFAKIISTKSNLTDPDEIAEDRTMLKSIVINGLSISSTGVYSVAGNFDALGEQESVTLRFAYKANDNSGETNALSQSNLVEVTIQGTNDAPVATASATIVANDVSYVGQLVASDVDVNDTLTYTYDNTSVSMTLSVSGLSNLDTLMAFNNASTLSALTELKAAASSFAVTGSLAGLLTLTPSTIAIGKTAVLTLLNFLNTNSGLGDIKDFIVDNKDVIIANTELSSDDITLIQGLLTTANISALNTLFTVYGSFIANPTVQYILSDNVISPDDLAQLSSNTTVQAFVANAQSLLAANTAILSLIDIPTIVSKLQSIIAVDTVNGEVSVTAEIPSATADVMIDLNATTGEYEITNPYLASLPDNTQVEVKFDYTVTDSAGVSDDSTAAIMITSENVDKVSASLDDDGTLVMGDEKDIDMASLLSNITSNINVADIDSIDLSSNEHILSNLTIEDFQEMVSDSSSNTLEIKGENNDTIKLDPAIWLKDTSDTDTNSVVDNADDNFVAYKATGTDSQVLTLLIDKDIIVNEI